jgi:uncharacterized membrane protein
VEKPNRPLAVIAYLLPLVGPLIVLAIGRKNLFATFHACQALVLAIIALLAPVGWAVAGLLVGWIPLAGPVIGASAFALVIAAYLSIAVAWVAGLINSARERFQPVPIFGGWGLRLFQRLGTAAVQAAA